MSRELLIEADIGYDTTADRPIEESQDAYIFLPEQNKYGVLDGVSGSKDGRLASIFVKKVILNGFSREPDIRALVRFADHALKLENERLGYFGDDRPQTTLSLLVLTDKRDAQIVHVGDSRIYLFRNDFLTSITKDDDILNWNKSSVPQCPVDLTTFPNSERDRIGKKLDNVTNLDDLDEIEKWFWKRKSWITKSLGKGTAEIDSFSVPTEPGDVWILTTDALPLNLTEFQILNIILDNKYSITNMVKELVSTTASVSKEKTNRSKPDDITVVAFKIV